jgi:hypothetical protein
MGENVILIAGLPGSRKIRLLCRMPLGGWSVMGLNTGRRDTENWELRTENWF